MRKKEIRKRLRRRLRKKNEYGGSDIETSNSTNIPD